jgi:hypothetical protein
MIDAGPPSGMALGEDGLRSLRQHGATIPPSVLPAEEFPTPRAT